MWRVTRKQFASRHDIFERMVKKIEKRQKDLLDDLSDHSDGDKAFVIGASYLLDVCSRAVELFDAESTKIEQKRYLLEFVLSNVTLEGETLHLTLKEPFDAVLRLAKTGKWYHLPDVLRVECYTVIIQIYKELRISKEYLGNGLLELGLSAA